MLPESDQTWSMIRSVAIVAIISAVVYSFINSLKRIQRSTDLIEKLPGPARSCTLLGNIPLMVLKYVGSSFEESKELYYNLMQAMVGYTQVYSKERIFRLWVAWEPWLVLWKPETVETVLSNNFLLEKSSQYNFLHDWLGTGLLTSTGSKWRSRRKLLIPAFHFKILHDFIPVFNEQANILIQKLKLQSNTGKLIDLVPNVTACALDIICGKFRPLTLNVKLWTEIETETIMGVTVDAQKDSNNEYCRAVNEVGECWLERLIQPTYWPDSLYYNSGRGKVFASKLKILHDFTRKVIKQRKNEILGLSERETNQNGEQKSRKAFLDLLLDHHLNGGDLTEEGIREEVDTFMFEGHDTTSMALSWILFLLGHHREYQEKVWPEIDEMFNEMEEESCPSISLDKIKDLKYLDCIVKEGLRLCPSVPFVGRRIHEDMTFKAGGKEYTVPSGTIVYVFIYMLHRDPEVFPNPETFDPDRFLPENSLRRNPFAYVPFSAGPRNCIGQRFALSELKIVLAFMLRNFRIESIDARDKILSNMEMVLRPKVPLNVRLHERIHS